MSEDTSPVTALIEHFAAAAAYVLSQIAGETLPSESAPAEPLEATTLVHIDFTGALEGHGEIALSREMSVRFAALLTGEAADAEYSEEHREAAAELIQQICGNAADRLRRAFGPMEVKPVLVAERDSENGESQLITIQRGDAPLQLELRLMAITPAAAAANASASTPSAEAAAGEGLPLPVPPPMESTGNRNLDLLLEIELDATLRFGTRQMLLREILELSSGSVVELDRAVQEPVDLLIDGRIIAQGEVVIVDGNYGLRVLQVASPGEKLACLPH